MSDQEEKAAKWDMVEQLRKDKEHLVVLKNQMKNLGNRWAEFVRVLQSPDFYVFDITPNTITVGKPNADLSRPIAQLGQTEVNWDSLKRLTEDYQKTEQSIKTLSASLNLPQ